MRTIVVNGCFDLLHAGHLTLLRRARAVALEGEKVVVLLNSDKSVRRLKGRDRPFNEEAFRVMQMQAIRYVDEVRVFDDEEQLASLLKELRPRVMVKGAEYRGRPVTGEEYVESFEYVEEDGHSTTKLARQVLLAQIPDISGG